MWLHKRVYKAEDCHLHITGGYKARVIGIEERYEEGDREKLSLCITTTTYTST